MREIDRREPDRTAPLVPGPTLRPGPLPLGGPLLLALLLLGGATPSTGAAQGCTASAGGVYSFSTSVSPGAGRVALYDVRVHAGGACDPAALVGRITLGSTRRLAITDGGVLVRILAPRTSHRDWNIITLTVVGRDRDDERTIWLSLDDLPGTGELTGSVRASYDGTDVVFAGRRGEARVAFSALDALARP